METPENLIPMADVVKASPYSRKTLITRIKDEGIQTYVDGLDRRRRLIDARDLPKLTEIRPAPRREPQGAA